MLMPQATRTSPQRRTPSTTVDSRLNDTRQGSPDKWTRFANGAVKEHDTETQARAGATEAASGGAKPRETGWDIAAEIAKKARKPGPGTGIGTGSVRTEELEPAKREGVGRKRWRDVCNAGGSGDEELVAQAKDAAPPTDGVADGIGAGPGQPNSKDEELLIDFGDNVEVEKLEENGSHQPHIEEGDLIDLMD